MAENGIKAVNLVRTKLEYFSENYHKHDFDEIGAASNILYRLDMFGDLSGEIIDNFKKLHYKVNLDLMGYDIVELTIKPKKQQVTDRMEELQKLADGTAHA